MLVPETRICGPHQCTITLFKKSNLPHFGKDILGWILDSLGGVVGGIHEVQISTWRSESGCRTVPLVAGLGSTMTGIVST